MKKFLSLILIFLASKCFSQLSSASSLPQQAFSSHSFCPAEIKAFMRCYPDIDYTTTFDLEQNDWKIDMTADLFFERTKKPKGKKSASLYWAGGRLLPKEELANKENYWVLQYKYENKLRDPKSYTKEEIEQIKQFGSAENRRNAPGTPMFFFDWLYSAQSRVIIEDHIIKTTFLGRPTRIHERVYDKLKIVEKKILEKKNEPEVKAFLSNLKSADAYHWREIVQTSRKSFHAYGIAIDILPKRLNRKAIYWSWEKDKLGEDRWMLVPLEKRWMPPKEVIKIFENEGFIWGGYWAIYDNMHFEYHPELTGQSGQS
ncbi:M15 family peptidase [Treponema ruminis]|uniref:Peptidase M15C domain-containing protein n=1 Tax=Treponema ruminis TaxID=744515 RepID=A0A7W8GBA8_9SPIR|nr:M15 family metallopeptidase [Treponema ruminis]MBB5227304.1 hypothetical protein [Treponema ruminis]QSI01182.1 M15 family peptidase [Treponema ruminis]